MGLTLCLKNEDVQAAAAAERRPHRYSSLKVNEVSIVTDPAILSEDEADAGAGFPVIKLTGDGGTPDQEAFAEKINLRAGEDVVTWLERLTSEAKLSLAVSLEEGDAYFYYPVKVFNDSIIMTDPFTNPLDNAAIFFKMSFNQTEEGDFTFGGPEMLKLTFADSGITSEKLLLTRKEVPMTELTGVELGGQVIKITAVPGLEFKSESGDTIVTCDENGVAKTGDGYSIHEDGIVRINKAEEVGDTEPPVEATPEAINSVEAGTPETIEDINETTGVEDTAKGNETANAEKLALTLDHVKSLMSGAGKSFSMLITPDGNIEISSDGSESAADASDVADESEQASEGGAAKSDIELRLEELEAELIRTKQQLAGSSTTDPEVGDSATKIYGMDNYPHEAPRVAADGKTDSGIFTRHIDKRLLDRRSRLQADLISG